MYFNSKALFAAIASTAFVGSAFAFTADATYFYPGLGACGRTNTNSDPIVALSTAQYAGGAHCGQSITVTYGGKSIDVTVVDECPGCGEYGIDLSPSAFQELAPLSVGRISVNWAFN